MRGWLLLLALLLLVPKELAGYAVKDSSVQLDLDPEMGAALPLIDQVHRETVRRGVIITSGSEQGAGHMPGSLHYSRRAIDVRTRDLSSDLVDLLEERLRQRLGSRFDVVNEGDHIHIELDPRS